MNVAPILEPLLDQKSGNSTKSKLVLATEPILHRGMNKEECKIICTSPIIPLREKTFFRLIYETQLRPFEVMNLEIENWDRSQKMVTAVRVKQKWDNKHKQYLPSVPRTAILTDNTNEMIRTFVSNRKKGKIFVNEYGEPFTDLAWFKMQIHHYATLLSIQKVKKFYIDGRPLHLVTLMGLREAGERQHDNAGGSRKLSAVASGHSMQVKERHYEKVGEDYEQVHESYRSFHPAFVEGW
jgi:integrase